MSTQSIIEKKQQHTTGHAGKWKVLLHNDNVNSMEHVMNALAEVFPGMDPQRAYDIMMEAHNTGVALVGTYVQEHAEFYAEQLCDRGLTSTIEAE